MALVELDDDLVAELYIRLEKSNEQAMSLGFKPWTLRHYIRDAFWKPSTRGSGAASSDFEGALMASAK